MKKKRELTIEKSETAYGDSYDVYEHGTYERHSVLAGQAKRMQIDSCSTLAEAQAAYPGAECTDDSTFVASVVPSYLHVDATIAGETWE